MRAWHEICENGSRMELMLATMETLPSRTGIERGHGSSYALRWSDELVHLLMKIGLEVWLIGLLTGGRR